MTVDFTEPPWSFDGRRYELDLDPEFCPKCMSKAGECQRLYHRWVVHTMPHSVVFYKRPSYEVKFAALNETMVVFRRRYICQAALPMSKKKLWLGSHNILGKDFYICGHEWVQELLGMNDEFKMTSQLFEWICGFAKEYETNCHIPTNISKTTGLSRSRVLKVLEFAKTIK